MPRRINDFPEGEPPMGGEVLFERRGQFFKCSVGAIRGDTPRVPRCHVCDGAMLFTGEELTSAPPQPLYRCEQCGETAKLQYDRGMFGVRYVD